MQHKRSKKEIEYCKYLSKAIKKLRKEKGVSGNCLALDSWLASSTFCRIENNQNSPQLITIAQIAFGLGMPLSKLIIEVEKLLPEDFNLLDET